MANQFYVDPAASRGALQGIGALASGVMQKRQEQQEQERMQGIISKAQDLYSSGTPEQIAEFAIANPEMGEILSQQVGFRSEATKQNMIDSMRQLMTATPEQAEEIFAQRIQTVLNEGGDPSDTIAEFETFQRNPEGFRTSMEMAYAGMDPEGYQAYQGAQKAAGAATTGDTANLREFETWRAMPEGPEKDALGRMIKAVPRAREDLSALAEKQLDLAINNAITAGNAATSYDSLAEQFKNLDAQGGAVASVGRRFREFTGLENAETQLRQEYAKLRNSQVVKDLPPGVASDKDIDMIKEGFPKDTASPAYIASWMESMAKVQRADMMFNEFKANYISENNSQKGMLKAWKKRVAEMKEEQPEDDQGDKSNVVFTSQQYGDVTEDDIQETMRANNMTREQVMQRLQGM